MGIRRTTLAIEETSSPTVQVKYLAEESGLPYLETIDIEKINVELIRCIN